MKDEKGETVTNAFKKITKRINSRTKQNMTA